MVFPCAALGRRPWTQEILADKHRLLMPPTPFSRRNHFKAITQAENVLPPAVPIPSVAPGCFRFSSTALFKSPLPCHTLSCCPLGPQPPLLGNTARHHCPDARVLQSGLPVCLSSHPMTRTPCTTSTLSIHPLRGCRRAPNPEAPG